VTSQIIHLDRPKGAVPNMQINALEYLYSGAYVSHPDKTAVSDQTRAITFRDLDSEARVLARRLATATSAVNHPIAVFLPRSVEVVVSDVAILLTGNFYTNLDDKSPVERLGRLLGNVKPELVITDSDHVALLTDLGIDPAIFVLIDAPAPPSAIDDSELERRRAQVIDTDPICLINTSGSTGVPKSVILSHRGTIDFIDWCLDNFDFSSDDVFGSLSPLHFDIYTLEIYVAFATGSTIHLIPEQLAAFPKALVEFLVGVSATFIFWVPTVMVNIANLGILDTIPPTTLRRVFFAGEVFPTKHMNIWRRALPSAQFVNLYGPIEIHVDCTYFVVDRDIADGEPLPIGSACRNSGVLILDDNNELINEPGKTGELCVRGSSLAMGYYNNPEQTDRAFVQNPLNTSFPERIYRTGDLAYYNERHEIMFVGRRDFQIKHQGFRIELPEIETAVLSLAEVKNACVLYDREKKAITLVYESDEELTAKQLRLLLRDRLPKYMLPTEFVRLADMPRNSNGKIDRQLLATHYTP
jgi:D-alanine--poly(phosphoribitol) ligase subunit 1